MKQNLKKPPIAVTKKEIYICRSFLFASFIVLLLLRTFFRENASIYFEKLTWFLNFNFITDSTFTESLNSKYFKPFAAICLIAFLWMLSVFFEKFYHSFFGENKFGKTMLIAITAVSPGLFLYYCSPTVHDRSGYLVLMLILLRLLYFKSNLLIWMTPVFSVMCVLIQHKCFLTLYPAVFIINIILCKEYRFKKSCLFTDAAISFVTFIIIDDFDIVKKQSDVLKELMINFASVIPVVVFVLFIFLSSFSVKKESKYLLYFALPTILSLAAFFTESDIGSVFAQWLISLMLIIVFAVINNESAITANVNRVINFLDNQPVIASVILFYEAYFLRIDPNYFGNVGHKIFDSFSF